MYTQQKQNIFARMSLEPWILITKNWKQPRCPSTLLWVNYRLLYSDENEQMTVSWNTMIESHKYNIEWEKPYPKEYITYDSTHMKLKKTRQLINNFRSQDTTSFGEEERSSDREEYMGRPSDVGGLPIS